MEEDRGERFFLALDCGALSPAELQMTVDQAHMQQVVPYRHAKAVWQQIQDQVVGRGDFLSCRTMATGGHFYTVVYGENVARAAQMRAFRVMDTYRQQHPGFTFVRLPKAHEDHLLEARRDVARGRSPGTYTAKDITKQGVLHETHSVRYNVLDTQEAAVPIDPPFESIPIDPQGERFVMSLDCGRVPTGDKQALHHALSISAEPFKAIKDLMHVSDRETRLSVQRSAHFEHLYLTAYGYNVSREEQMRVFRILDRVRQQYGLTFARHPRQVEDLFFEYREERVSREENITAIKRTSGGEVTNLYSTNKPSLRELSEDVPPSVTIDPPFESIPLFQEKKPQPVKVSARRPFLERYLTALRLDYEDHQVLLRKRGEDATTLRKLEAVGMAMIEAGLLSRKYRFTRSALAMVTALVEHMGESGTQIRDLPQTALFIEFAEPLLLSLPSFDPVTGLAFMQPFAEYQRWVEQDTRGGRARVFGPLSPAQLERHWGLSLLAEDGGTVMNLIYDSTQRAWRVPKVRVCPSGGCQQTMTPEETLKQGAFTNWELCPECARMLAYFARWFPVALLAIAGEFAEEAEPVERTVTETVTRKEKRPGTGKYDEKRETVTFRVVTFDASVRQQPTRVEEETTAEQEEVSRPSWLDLAIKEGTVVYVRRGFGKSVRHLDPAHNPRWKVKQDVTVRAFEKRVPMTVARLQKVITRVVASKYEEPERREVPGERLVTSAPLSDLQLKGMAEIMRIAHDDTKTPSFLPSRGSKQDEGEP